MTPKRQTGNKRIGGPDYRQCVDVGKRQGQTVDEVW